MGVGNAHVLYDLVHGSLLHRRELAAKVVLHDRPENGAVRSRATIVIVVRGMMAWKIVVTTTIVVKVTTISSTRCGGERADQ